MHVFKLTRRCVVAFAFLGAFAMACQTSSTSAAGEGASDDALSSLSGDDERGTDSGDEVDSSENNDTAKGEDPQGDWPHECDNDPDAKHDYTYPEPNQGLECSADEPCGEGGVCSDVWFPSSQGYTGAQCYPSCRMEGTNTPCCETGDLCVVLEEGAYACLARGWAKKESLKLKILPKGTSVNHADVAYVGANVNVDGKKIALNMSYIVEDEADFDGDGQAEDVVIVEFEGVAGIAGTWVFQITVPKEKWTEGELAAEPGDAARHDFDAVLTKWVGQRMTVKAVTRAGSVTIAHPGAPCKAGVCDKAELGFDIDLLAIGAAIEPQS